MAPRIIAQCRNCGYAHTVKSWLRLEHISADKQESRRRCECGHDLGVTIVEFMAAASYEQRRAFLEGR
jgi:NMD protein affecting ribosome stability and mRNA decay